MAEFDYAEAHKRATFKRDPDATSFMARRNIYTLAAFDEAVNAYNHGCVKEMQDFAGDYFSRLRRELESVLAGKRVNQGC